MGTRKKARTKKLVLVSIHMRQGDENDVALKNELQSVSDKAGRTVATIVRDGILRELQEIKSTHPAFKNNHSGLPA